MTVHNIVVVSDLHCGCQFGLCPGAVRLDGGGTYHPSRLQKIVGEWWQEWQHDWLPVVCRGEPYVLVINGDALEGRHHNATTQLSQNIADHQRIAYDCLYSLRNNAAAAYYVRGTEAHGGPAGEYEERLALQLDCVPDETGLYTRWELRYKTAGGIIDFQHHIATCGSNQYETTALCREYAIACEEAGRWGYEAPAVVARAHRHRQSETRVPTRGGYGICFTTPGWQLKTPLTWRMAGSRQSTPQFGVSLIRAGDEEMYTRHWVRNIERSPIEEGVEL